MLVYHIAQFGCWCLLDVLSLRAQLHAVHCSAACFQVFFWPKNSTQGAAKPWKWGRVLCTPPCTSYLVFCFHHGFALIIFPPLHPTHVNYRRGKKAFIDFCLLNVCQAQGFPTCSLLVMYCTCLLGVAWNNNLYQCSNLPSFVLQPNPKSQGTWILFVQT